MPGTINTLAVKYKQNKQRIPVKEQKNWSPETFFPMSPHTL